MYNFLDFSHIIFYRMLMKTDFYVFLSQFSAKGTRARIFLLGEKDSLAKGVVIKLKSGKSCIATKSDCLHEEVDTEGILSEDEYRGFWVETILTNHGYMEVKKLIDVRF